jgi:hypothetical protein
VLEDVEDEDRVEPGRMVDLVIADPPVEEVPGDRLVIKDDPPDAANGGGLGEILAPR